jgi:hypothetical protein
VPARNGYVGFRGSLHGAEKSLAAYLKRHFVAGA